jgi:hypothetical protein
VSLKLYFLSDKFSEDPGVVYNKKDKKERLALKLKFDPDCLQTNNFDAWFAVTLACYPNSVVDFKPFI